MRDHRGHFPHRGPPFEAAPLPPSLEELPVQIAQFGRGLCHCFLELSVEVANAAEQPIAALSHSPECIRAIDAGLCGEIPRFSPRHRGD